MIPVLSLSSAGLGAVTALQSLLHCLGHGDSKAPLRCVESLRGLNGPCTQGLSMHLLYSECLLLSVPLYKRALNQTFSKNCFACFRVLGNFRGTTF